MRLELKEKKTQDSYKNQSKDAENPEDDSPIIRNKTALKIT